MNRKATVHLWVNCRLWLSNVPRTTNNTPDNIHRDMRNRSKRGEMPDEQIQADQRDNHSTDNHNRDTHSMDHMERNCIRKEHKLRTYIGQPQRKDRGQQDHLRSGLRTRLPWQTQKAKRSTNKTISVSWFRFSGKERVKGKFRCQLYHIFHLCGQEFFLIVQQDKSKPF